MALGGFIAFLETHKSFNLVITAQPIKRGNQSLDSYPVAKV